MFKVAPPLKARGGIPAHLSVEQGVGSSPLVQMGPQASLSGNARALCTYKALPTKNVSHCVPFIRYDKRLDFPSERFLRKPWANPATERYIKITNRLSLTFESTMLNNSQNAQKRSPLTKKGTPKTFNINALQNRDMKVGMNEVLLETMKLSLSIRHLEESMRKDTLHLSNSLDRSFDYKSHAPLEDRALLLGLRLKVIEIKKRDPYVRVYANTCRYVFRDKFLGKVDVTEQFRCLLDPDRVSTVSIGRVRLVRKSTTVKALLSTMPLNVYPNAIKMDIIEKKMFDQYISAGDINYVPDMFEMLRELRSAVIRYPTKARNSSGVDLRRRKRYALEVIESFNMRLKTWTLQGGLLSLPDLSGFTSAFTSGKFTLEHDIGDRAIHAMDEAIGTMKVGTQQIATALDGFRGLLSDTLESLKLPLVVLLLSCAALLACRAGFLTPSVITLGLTLVSGALLYFSPALKGYISPVLEALKSYLLPVKQAPEFVLQSGCLDLVVEALCGFAFHGVFASKISQGGLTAFLAASSAMKKYREGAQFTIEWVSTMFTEFYEWVVDRIGKPGWSFSVISPTQVLRNEVNQLVDDLDKDGLFTRNRRFRYEALKMRGRELQARFLNAPKEQRETEGRAVDMILHALAKLNRFALPDNNEAQTRTETVGVNFIGPTGLGKTLMTADVATQVSMESAAADAELSAFFMRNPESLVYVYDPFANFQSGYRKQFAVCIDDALAFRNGTPSAQGDTSLYAILKYVGALQVDVEQAAIEDKGKVSFDSRILVISTNAVRLELPDMTHPAAVARRFSTYMVWVKDQFCLNPEERNPMNRRLDQSKLPRIGTEAIMSWSHLEFVLWNWMDGTPVEGVERCSYSDVIKLTASRVAINVEKYKDYSAYLKNLASNIHERNHGPMVLQSGPAVSDSCKLVEYKEVANRGGAIDTTMAELGRLSAEFNALEVALFSPYLGLLWLAWFFSLSYALFKRRFEPIQALGLLCYYSRSWLATDPCTIDCFYDLVPALLGQVIFVVVHVSWFLLVRERCKESTRLDEPEIVEVVELDPGPILFDERPVPPAQDVEIYNWQSPEITFHQSPVDLEIFELQAGPPARRPLAEEAYYRAALKVQEEKFTDLMRTTTVTTEDFPALMREVARTSFANGLAAKSRYSEESQYNDDGQTVPEESIYSATASAKARLSGISGFLLRTPVIKGVLAITGVAAMIFTLLMGGYTAQSGDVKPVKKSRSRFAKKKVKNIFVKQGASISQNFEERYESVARKNVFTVRFGNRLLGTATGVQGRSIMMPMHFGDIISEGDLDTEVSFTGQMRSFTLTAQELVSCPWVGEYFDTDDDEDDDRGSHQVRSDVLFITLPDKLPQFKDISDLFIPEDQLSRFKSFSAIFSKDRFSLGCRAKLEGHFEIADEFGGLYQTSVSTKYNCKTRLGDCGNLLWVADSCTPLPFIVSMHVAGDNGNTGVGLVLTREYVSNFLDHVCTEESTRVIQHPREVELQSGDFGYEVLREEKLLNNSPHHNLVKAETFGQIYPTTKVLSMLRPTEIDGVLIDPMEVARSKYGKTSQLFDLDRLGAVSEHVAHEILERMSPYEPPEVWTKEEAVRGREEVPRIPIKTSCGYPYNIEHKGKSDFFGSGEELDFSSTCCTSLFKEIDDQIESIKKGGDPEHIFMDFLKPETREKEKYLKGATRMISAGPLDLTIITRMYFGSLLSESSRSRITNGFALGVNPYKEWGLLHHKHTRKSGGRYSMDGDYGNYDGSQEAELIMSFKTFARSFYYNGAEAEHKVRDWIISKLARSIHIVNVGFKAYVYRWEGSNSSGGVLTTLLNMFLNHVAITYGFSVVLQPVKGCGYEFAFTKCMDITVFGDDNLITVSSGLAERVQPKEFARALGAVGLKYTGADKRELGEEYKPITECTFLKRGILCSPDYVAAPLEMASIFQPLNWCSKSATLEERRLVIESVLGELALHGKECYNLWAPKVVTLCTPLYGHLTRTTYDRALSDIKGSDFIY